MTQLQHQSQVPKVPKEKGQRPVPGQLTLPTLCHKCLHLLFPDHHLPRCQGVVAIHVAVALHVAVAVDVDVEAVVTTTPPQLELSKNGPGLKIVFQENFFTGRSKYLSVIKPFKTHPVRNPLTTGSLMSVQRLLWVIRSLINPHQHQMTTFPRK